VALFERLLTHGLLGKWETGRSGELNLQIFKAIQKQKKIILLHGLSSERADISITVGANPRTMEHWLLSPKGVEQERYGK